MDPVTEPTTISCIRCGKKRVYTAQQYNNSVKYGGMPPRFCGKYCSARAHKKHPRVKESKLSRELREGYLKLYPVKVIKGEGEIKALRTFHK